MKQYGKVADGRFYIRYVFNNNSSGDMKQMLKILREAGDDASVVHYDAKQVVVEVYMGYSDATGW